MATESDGSCLFRGHTLWMVEQCPPRSLNLYLLISNSNLIAPLEDTFFEETSHVAEELIIAEK